MPKKHMYLVHYASPYYDPVYAHKYYEEHKKLKGRHSTSGLNDTGKAAASYVKSKIYEERDQKIEKSKTDMQSEIDEINAQIEELRYLSGAAKEQAKAELEANIQSLRDDANNKKDRIREALELKRQETSSDIADRTERDKNRTDQLRSQIKNLGKGHEAQKEKLRQEIDEINASRKEENASAREDLATERANASGEIKNVSEQLKSDVSVLREDFKTLRDNINTATKEDISNFRSQIKDLRTKTSAAIKQHRQDAEDTYDEELGKIASEKQYQKTKKRR